MGNRGGRIHDPEARQLHPTRRWASKQWICCLISFKSRHRTVMGSGYTELFFLDEITALAAGHRPCFECRRQDARHFAECFAKAHQLDRPPKAAEMDNILHMQRLNGRNKRCFVENLEDLPGGTMITRDGSSYLLKNRLLHRWSPSGYVDRGVEAFGDATVLTPPAIVGVLKAGYQPCLHHTTS